MQSGPNCKKLVGRLRPQAPENQSLRSVVASNSCVIRLSGCAEILKYALKVDFWDVDAMSDAIYGLLQYPAISHFAVQNGYDEVNSLKWTAAAAKVKAVYESAVEDAAKK